MSQECSLCPKVQFMSPEYSIYPHRTVYVPTVYVSTVQFMSQEYSLCTKVQFMSPEYSIYPTEQYMFPQFMFPQYSLCPKCIVHFP